MRYFRVRIENAAGSFVSGLTFTSFPGGTNPYLAAAPEGAGQEIDILRGKVTYGGYTVQIIDPVGIRAVTAVLADALGQYDLLGRVADVSTSPDGSTWTPKLSGFVAAIRYPAANLAEITIGDALRIDRRRDVFGSIQKPDGTPSAFDKATAIVGGPVRGGWGSSTAFDYGPWRMDVGSASGTTVRLDFLSGSVPVTNQMINTPAYAPRSGTLGADATTLIDARALSYQRQRDSGWYYPGLEVRVEKVLTPFTVTLTYPIVGEVVNGVPAPFTQNGQIYVYWSGTLPTVGDDYWVHVTPIEITPENPLHVQGHPIDIHTALWTEAGIAYDATSAAAVKAIIGPLLTLVLRIDRKWKLADFQEQVLQGPFRYGWRQGTDGEREFYSTRREAAVPGTSIVMADLLGSAEAQPVIFEIDESSIVRSVSVTETAFSFWTQVNAEQRPPDTALERRETITIEHAFVVDGEDLHFDIPGYIGTLFSFQGHITVFPGALNAFTEALASDILSRFGYGCPSGELLVKESITTQPGQEEVLTLAHQINGAVRGGSRIVQIVSRTEQFASGGVLLKFLDSGLTSQVPTVPTFTIAANGTSAKAFADIALTNAATLITDGSVAVFEWGTGGSAPATGSTLIRLDPNVATGLTTPRVDSGTTVWVRVRSENAAGVKRPSAWSSWASVNLADLTAPTGLSAPGDNLIEWSAGEGPQEVLWRRAAESVDVSLGIIPTGSQWFDMTPFVPSAVSIVATVRSHDALPYQGVSTSATVTFTTATSLTLTAPSSVNADRLVPSPPEDAVDWTVTVANPPGTTYHVEQSITSGTVGFTEVGTVVDDVSTVVTGTYNSDTWYRVRASKPGYTTTAYSSAFQLTV